MIGGIVLGLVKTRGGNGSRLNGSWESDFVSIVSNFLTEVQKGWSDLLDKDDIETIFGSVWDIDFTDE